MGFFDISDRMSNSYLMDQRNLKWTTKLFFHLLDLTLLNSWILLSSCKVKCTHKDFRLLLVRNLIEEAGRSHYRSTPSLVGRPSTAAANVMRLDSRLNQHWPAKHKNAATFVQSRASKRSLYTNVPNVMWVCAWFRVSSITTQKQICKAVSLQLAWVCVCVLCGDWRMNQGATEPLQQPELCD